MKKFVSLSNSLTYRIMAVVLVMMAVVIGIVYFHVREYMQNEAEERYQGVLERDHEEFRRRLSDVRVATKNNLYNVERDIENPDVIIKHLERILRVNPTIITCGLLYQPGHFPGRGRCMELIATRDSAGVIHTSKIENDDNAYAERYWFKDGIENDTAQWSDVYFEYDLIPGVTGRRQLTTYYEPVHDKQGRPVALFCSDLPLDFLSYEIMDDLMEKIHKYEKGSKHHSYNFVIDHDGTYIVHPDERRILNANFFEESKRSLNKVDDQVSASMLRGENGSALVEVDGVPSWIYYRTVKHMDWMIVIVVPEEVISLNGRMLNTIILMVAILGLLVIYFICRRMIRRTTKPLNRFARSTREMAKGNFQSQLPEVEENNEVRVLHDAFADMQHSLADYVDKLQKTTSEKASIEQELKIANGIQMALLPKTFPERSDLSLYAFVDPALEVGGDLYDFFLRDDRLLFCIGDVSGKGVPAALMMAVMRAMFRSEARRGDSASAIVNTMNHNLSYEYTAGYFVTMFVGILDLRTGHLDYCNAGHEHPLVSGEPLPVKRNLPVGALPDWNYEGQEATLQSGDTLFLYTDGLSEAKNADNKLFGRQHVHDLVNKHNDCTPRQLAELVKDEVGAFVGDTEQSDDLTLLIIKWQQPEVFNSHLSIRTDMDDIEQIDQFIAEASQQAQFSTKETKQMRLAIEEAVANVVNYSQATYVNLDASVNDRQMKVTITDDGIPFDATADSTTDLSLSPDQRPPGGLGIMLLHRMTDMLEYKRTDNCNVLTIVKKRK